MNEKLKESDPKIFMLQTRLDESVSARTMQRKEIQILQIELKRSKEECQKLMHLNLEEKQKSMEYAKCLRDLESSNKDIMKYKDLKIQHLENDAIQQEQKIKTLEQSLENQRSMFRETTELRNELENSQRNLTIAKGKLSPIQREQRKQIKVSERAVEAVDSDSSKNLQKENETLRNAVQVNEEMLKKLKDDYEEKEKQYEIKIKELEDEITKTQERADKTITTKWEHKSSKNSEEIAKLKRQLTEITTEKEKMHQETLNIHSKMKDIEKEKDDVVAKKVKEIRNLENDKEELLVRLSEMAGRRLTGDYPNIADLSDINRPTKLAEKYAELYDIEWTDAYSYLENLDAYKGSETTVIAALMLMLTNIPKQDQQVKDILEQLKDQRKRAVQPSQNLTAEHRKQVEQAFPNLDSSIFESSALKSYLQKCLQLCWLMVIQDPPVHLECKVSKKGDLFNENMYKEYSQAGPFIKYTVLPAMFLGKDGPLLCKGVVQCTKRLTGSVRTPAGKTVIEVKRKSSSVRISGAQSFTTVPISDQVDGKTIAATEKQNSHTAPNADKTDVWVPENERFTYKL